MEILSSYLPSKGIAYKFDSIEVKPLSYLTMLRYTKELESAKNPLSRYLTHIKYLISDLPEYDKILAYDAHCIMAIRSFLSISSDLKTAITISYNCPYHNKVEAFQLKLENFEYINLDPEIYKIKTFRLSDSEFRFRLPTIKEFVSCAEYFKVRIGTIEAIKVISILSLFKDIRLEAEQIYKAVVESTSANDDIGILEYLYKNTISFQNLVVKCPTSKGANEIKVPILDISLDPFSYLSKSLSTNKDFYVSKNKFRT